MNCPQTDMSIARAAVRELLICEARLVLELRTARAALGLADGSLLTVIHKDHPLWTQPSALA